MAKHTYVAKADTPLGVEVSLKLGENIIVYEEHPNAAYSEHWVMVENSSGGKGYAPKSYVYIPDGLPWLQQKKLVRAQSSHTVITCFAFCSSQSLFEACRRLCRI